ncbi:LacI family DNA-binding transcriptional regulator [Pseudonocardia sp. CA-107938]|uniref:LacI family DNA-binding transcriptional regulator n=1 Tax=Pseudonocardia sp. CA-107938 TaxID=3240021 RepID=UPI003D8D8571
MVTSRDVARVAGVSQSTVSYVMSGRRPISEETRRRVEAAIEELTYQPNAGARALASQRTQVVGLVVPFEPNDDTKGLLPFIETIAACAREQDHDVLLVTADEGAAGLQRLARRSLCDAIVMMDIGAVDERIPVARSLGVPVILIGVPDDPTGLHCVDVDFVESGRIAATELAACGHDRIVVIGHSPATVARRVNYVGRFQRGVEAAAAELGLPCHLVAPVEPGRDGARVAVDAALAAGGPQPGIVVPNTVAIQYVLHELQQRDLVPGRDLSVIGICPDMTADAMFPQVSNVSLEPRDVSRRAMQTLFGLLDREGTPPEASVELVQPRLTRRSTTLPHPAQPQP